VLPPTIELDHRFVDGYQAATMARIFREYLADPATFDPVPSSVSPRKRPRVRAVQRQEASDRRKVQLVEGPVVAPRVRAPAASGRPTASCRSAPRRTQEHRTENFDASRVRGGRLGGLTSTTAAPASAR